MAVGIKWQFFVAVSTLEKCKKVLENASKMAHVKFEDVKSERYWKDKALVRVTANSIIKAPTAKDGFYNVMLTANRLADVWNVTGPHDDESLEFGGTANQGSIRLPGIDLITFDAHKV